MKITCTDKSPQSVRIYDDEGTDITDKLQCVSMVINMGVDQINTVTMEVLVDEVEINGIDYKLTKVEEE